MKIHVHRRGRLSTPSVDVCDCGAILVLGRKEWLETSWVPPPLRPLVRERPTTPLPLALIDLLAGVCR
jgi:hypothetical protein